MEWYEVGLGLLGLLMFLIAVGVPIPFALAAASLPFLWQIQTFETSIASAELKLWGVWIDYILLAVPLFVFLGELIGKSNIGPNLYQFLHQGVRVRGSAAYGSIGACAGFGAVCGSSLATASTMGRVALPELERLHYAPRLATGTLAAGGTLGILIPPSVALVIYAIIVEASIIQMFQAAIIPGLLAVLFFILVIAAMVRLKPELAPEVSVMTPPEKRRALLRLIPVVVIFGSIILGLGIGLFTPTPAAAVGAMAILLYGILLRFKSRDAGLSLSGIKSSILDTAVTSGMIYFILFGAEVLKGFFARAGLPAAMASWATESGVDPWMLMILLLLMLIVLGCFMDSLAMILVVVPFFWPALVEINGGDYATAATAAYGLGIEDLKIWFGIVALVVVELGLITPPVGLNVFIIATMARGIRMGEVFAGVMPFFGVEIIRIAILLLLPGLCLFLPHLLSGG